MESTTRKKGSVFPISHYWSMVKDMDDSQKKELVIMLVDSMKLSEPKKEELNCALDASDFAGIWSDEEYMDADEMVKQMKEARRFKNRNQIFEEL